MFRQPTCSTHNASLLGIAHASDETQSRPSMTSHSPTRLTSGDKLEISAVTEDGEQILEANADISEGQTAHHAQFLRVDPLVSSPELRTDDVHEALTAGSSSNRCQDNSKDTLPNVWPSHEGSRTSTSRGIRSLLGSSPIPSFIRSMSNKTKRHAKSAQRVPEAIKPETQEDYVRTVCVITRRTHANPTESVRLARVKFDSGNPYNLIRRGFVEGELQDAIMPSPNGPRDFLEGGLQGAIVAFQDGPMDILDMANGTKFRAIAEIELRWYGKGEEFDPKTYTSLFYVSESREARFDVVIGSETCAKEGLLTLNFPVGLPGFPGIRRNTPGPVPKPDLKAAQHAQDQTRATEAALMKAHEQRKSQPPSYGSVLPKSVPGTGGSGGLSRS